MKQNSDNDLKEILNNGKPEWRNERPIICFFEK